MLYESQADSTIDHESDKNMSSADNVSYFMNL